MLDRLILVAAGLAVGGAAAAAEPATRASSRTVKASATDLFALAELLAKRGQGHEAQRILRLLSRDPDGNVRNEARYRQSLLLEADGATAAAAVLLRRILDEKPGAAAVRLKLASMLHKMGDEDSALRELRALRSTELPPAVARFVDRVSASLQASKPFGVQLELALAPDTNINRATQSDTLGTIFGDFAVDEDAKRKSGVGAALRGSAHRRVMLGRDVSIVTRANTDLNLYRDKRFNDISAELSAGPEFRLLGTRLTGEVGFGQRWYGMKAYQRQLRVSASAARALDKVSQASVDASLRWSDNRLNELQDGRGLTLRARYERALSPTMSVAAAGTKDRFKAEDDAYSTRSWTTGLTAYRNVGRTTISVGAEVGRLKADEWLAILPKARQDKLSRFSLGAVLRQFTVGGFAPLTRIVVERNRSTVALYDYRRTRTEVGISRAF